MKKVTLILMTALFITCGCSSKIECKTEDKTEGRESISTLKIYYKEDTVNEVVVDIKYENQNVAKEMCDFYKKNASVINNNTVKCSKNSVTFKEYKYSENNKITKEEAIKYYESLNYTCE